MPNTIKPTARVLGVSVSYRDSYNKSDHFQNQSERKLQEPNKSDLLGTLLKLRVVNILESIVLLSFS